METLNTRRRAVTLFSWQLPTPRGPQSSSCPPASPQPAPSFSQLPSNFSQLHPSFPLPTSRSLTDTLGLNSRLPLGVDSAVAPASAGAAVDSTAEARTVLQYWRPGTLRSAPRGAQGSARGPLARQQLLLFSRAERMWLLWRRMARHKASLMH